MLIKDIIHAMWSRQCDMLTRIAFWFTKLTYSFNPALFCGIHEKYAMWKFIVDVVHDFVSSLQPDVGRGFLHVSNVFLSVSDMSGLILRGYPAVGSTRDVVIKWKHFPRYWPFVRGIRRSPVNSLHKGQWHRALLFSLICAWINGRVNYGEAGDLRRHHAH